MTLHTPRKEPHPDKNVIFSGWQIANIFGVDLESSVQPQYMASLDLWRRLVYYPGIQY